MFVLNREQSRNKDQFTSNESSSLLVKEDEDYDFQDRSDNRKKKRVREEIDQDNMIMKKQRILIEREEEENEVSEEDITALLNDSTTSLPSIEDIVSQSLSKFPEFRLYSSHLISIISNLFSCHLELQRYELLIDLYSSLASSLTQNSRSEVNSQFIFDSFPPFFIPTSNNNSNSSSSSSFRLNSHEWRGECSMAISNTRDLVKFSLLDESDLVFSTLSSSYQLSSQFSCDYNKDQFKNGIESKSQSSSNVNHLSLISSSFSNPSSSSSKTPQSSSSSSESSICSFGLLIVDEACQCSEPSILIPLLLHPTHIGFSFFHLFLLTYLFNFSLFFKITQN